MTETEETPLHAKLRKVLALTNSPVEGEAQAAAEMLQKLLTAHNLSMADLEKKGANKPGVRREEHDLGKAAFKWKLDLADAIAEHYYCHPLVDRVSKTVAFVGRPDNVESLQMLYGWIIDQIKRIAAEERRNHFIRTEEHIDPLRWQVNFGIGAVRRLRQRLVDIRKSQSSDVTALVVSHNTEISDWLESQGRNRIDGKLTKAQQESEARWQKYMEEREAEEKKKEALRQSDPQEFARLYPWETPEAIAEREKKAKEQEKRDRRNAARRKGPAWRPTSAKNQKKEEQADTAYESGKSAADRVNLQPFVEGDKEGGKPRLK